MTEKALKIAVLVRTMPTANYENALRGLGAVPVVLRERFDPEEYDGLLLPGGDDVDPARFGQENCGSEGIDQELDALQFGMLDRFIQRKKPVFGICRGHQVLNIYFGGDLIQDLGEEKNLRHRRWNGQDRVHETDTEADSWLGHLYGERYAVNSAHHQALGRIGEGLRVSSRSGDGVVEALEHEMLPVWSVQWHPERMCFANARTDTVDGSLALRYFLQQCEKGGLE